MDYGTDPELAQLCRSLKSAYPDARILLFGSRMRGDHLHGSDYDLLVISTAFAGLDFRSRIIRLYGHKPDDIAADPIPLTPDEWEERKGELSIIGGAAREGVFLE